MLSSTDFTIIFPSLYLYKLNTLLVAEASKLCCYMFCYINVNLKFVISAHLYMHLEWSWMIIVMSCLTVKQVQLLRG